MMIKGAVFDMDGLMFDTERLVYENWQHMMDELGLPYDLETFKQTIGRRKKEVELFYRATYGEDFPYWELSGRGKSMYVKRIEHEGLPVKKGLYDILRWLRESGVRIALATSTSRHTTELNLRLAKVSGYFDALVCGEDVFARRGRRGGRGGLRHAPRAHRRQEAGACALGLRGV